MADDNDYDDDNDDDDDDDGDDDSGDDDSDDDEIVRLLNFEQKYMTRCNIELNLKKSQERRNSSKILG